MKKQNEKVFVSMLTDYGFRLAFGNEEDTEFLGEVIQGIIKPPYKRVYSQNENSIFKVLVISILERQKSFHE